MKILFVCMTDPRETAYGGQQRTHVIWKGLQSVGDVWTVVPVPHREQEEFDDKSRIFKVCLEKRYSLGWFAQRLLKRFIPYWDCSWAYDQKAFQRLIASQIGKVDAVISRYIRPAAAFKLWKIAPLYVDADDIHTFEFDAETRVVGNSLKRRLQRWLLARFQFRIYGKAQKLWVPAPEQVALLPDYPLSCLPNIPCRTLPDYSDVLGDKNTLFFVGLMSSEPNIVAIDWFLTSFWTKLKGEFPKLRLNIVGGGLPAQFVAKWKDFRGVNILGCQADIDNFYKEALAVITPMQIGMGSCIKVVEALGIGRCVISTRQGLRGIPVRERYADYGMMTFEDYESLCVAIKTLQKVDLRSEDQKGGRNYVQANFSQLKIATVLRCDMEEDGND